MTHDSAFLFCFTQFVSWRVKIPVNNSGNLKETDVEHILQDKDLHGINHRKIKLGENIPVTVKTGLEDSRGTDQDWTRTDMKH